MPEIDIERIEGVKIDFWSTYSDNRGTFNSINFPFLELNEEKNSLQVAYSVNNEMGTLRGMHLQRSCNPLTKHVSCINGEIWDVLVDLRPNSSTFQDWGALKLSQDIGKVITVPAGIAHGYITLSRNSTVLYFISGKREKRDELTLSYQDSSIGIVWPQEPLVLSASDLMGLNLEKILEKLEC